MRRMEGVNRIALFESETVTLRFTVRRPNSDPADPGGAWDLTGASSVKFSGKEELSDSVAAFSLDCTVDDATAGKCSVEVDTTGLPELMTAELAFVIAGKQYVAEQFQVLVRKRVVGL